MNLSIRSASAALAAGAIFLASMVAVAPMTGCEAIQDGVAYVSGAPTSKEFEAQREKIEAADKAREEAERVRDALAAQVEAEERKQASIDAQREALEAQYAAMAGQLVTMTGEARRAIMDIMDGVRARMEHVGDLARQQAELVAQYQTAIAQADASLAEASESIAAAETEFEALLAQRDDAFGGLTGAVNAIADTAITLGVPAPMVEQGRGLIVAGLGLATGATPTGAIAWFMRRRARNAAQVIKATEKYGLLDDTDPARKKAAKAELPPAAVAELERLTKNVKKVPNTALHTVAPPNAAA